MTKHDEPQIIMPQIALESFSGEDAQLVQAAATDPGSALVCLIRGFCAIMPEHYRPLTRIVFTGDFARSVNQRIGAELEADRQFTIERGSGVVAGKTMDKQPDGTVEVLFPHDLVLLEPDDVSRAMLQHLGAHEAVHASVNHSGTDPFLVHRRESFGPALIQFVSMAGEQANEHLAEYLANQVSHGITGTQSTDKQVHSAFAAWQDTLETKLPALDRFDPDYFHQGMLVSLEALHILWKTLAYLAAEVRDGDVFETVPEDIRRLNEWKEDVEPWWDGYISLLSEIPMTIKQDVDTTDESIKKLGLYLQSWALGIGFDHHDTAQGGWFRITRPGLIAALGVQPPALPDLPTKVESEPATESLGTLIIDYAKSSPESWNL